MLRRCLILRLAERLIIAVEDVQMVVPQLPDLRRQTVDQVAVVGDQEDSALKLFQHCLQDFLCRNVEVVGRLIEQQEIGSFQSQQGQRQPATFSAAEGLDRFENVFTSKEILSQITARLA